MTRGGGTITTGPGMPTWAYTGKWPMREDTTTEGCTTNGWAQPTWLNPKAKPPNTHNLRDQALNNQWDMCTPLK